MDKLIYLILNKKNDIDENINLNMILNNKINYVLVNTKNTGKSYYDKKEHTIYVKNKEDKLKYSLYWIYKQKKYEYIYVINDNDDILDTFPDDFSNYKFFTDKFKKDKKTSYPISNYFIDKKCLKILLSSIDKIKITNKEISRLFRKYKIYLNKIYKNNTEKKENNLEIEEIEEKEIIEKVEKEIKNTKILYLVLCCDNKQIYIDNQKRIIEMLENAKVNYLLLKGNTESVIYNEENKTLFVDVVDVYENLPIKIYKGYEWVYNNTDYDYVYKIDDNFVFTNKNKIPDKQYDYYGNYLIKNLHRKWHFGKCSNNELNNLEYTGNFIAPYAAGGLGYILSRKSLEILLKNKEMFYDKNEYYEDKVVGDILYKNKIYANNIYVEKLEYKPINKNKEYKSNNNKQNASVVLYDLKKDKFNLKLDEKLNNKNKIIDVRPSKNKIIDVRPSKNNIIDVIPSKNNIIDVRPSKNKIIDVRPSKNNIIDVIPSKNNIIDDILSKNNIIDVISSKNNIIDDILHKNNIKYKQNKSLVLYDLKKDTFNLDFNEKINNIINTKLNNDLLIINSFYLLKYQFENNNNKSNIIISLSAIPPRFVSEEFILVIDSLYNQILKPEKIVINICHEYRRKFEYDKNKFEKYKKNLLKKYDNLIINYTIDYGPITKILGLYNIINNLSEESIIICLDDDWLMDNKLTYYYSLIYQLYNCDCVFIDERDMIIWNKKFFSNMEIQKKENIFFDNYQNFVYGWLSFSFKVKHINELYNFYNKIIAIDKKIINHDDLILTIFYKTMNLYACGINIIFNNLRRLKLDDLEALRTNAWTLRNDLEIKFLENYNIKYYIRNNHVYIKNLNENNSKLVINKKIGKRNLLLNVENIIVDPSKNNFQFRQIDIKYFNEKTFILTLTIFEDVIKDKENYIILINNNNYEITLINNTFSKKLTYFISYKNKINCIPHKNYDFKIVQTKKSNIISLYNFYSISTIINYIPDVEYIFFDDNDVIEYINNYNPIILKIYNKVIPGAFKADLFRALYIYLNGGIYLDCKNILYNKISQYFNNESFFVKDLNNGIYNGIFYSKSKNIDLHKYIIQMLLNMHMNYYTDHFLGICGPQLLKKYINNNLIFKNNITSDDKWKDAYITDNKNNIYIKCTFSGYYEENNYLEKDHYSVLWHNKNVYNKTEIDYKKINFIKNILWINLDRSTDRKEYMENILSNINIPNTRISATDGKNEKVREYILPQITNITDYEIACSLSHIKAISYLYELIVNENTINENNYYIICEDDISLDNLILFNHDLKYIIENAPEFDVLMIYKTFHKELCNLYSDWNIEFNKGCDDHIAGTCCYVISTNGIKNIYNFMSYKDEKFTINKTINVADKFIYKDFKTYVYKYNFIANKEESSTIHSEHVDWHIICSDKQLGYIIRDNLVI